MNIYIKKTSPLTLPQFVVVFYLVIMSVQIIGIEGMTISPVKVVAMGCSPLIAALLWGQFMKNIKVLFYMLLYVTVLIICCHMAGGAVIWDRVFYRCMFLLTFCCVYQSVYSGGVSIEFFRKLLIFLVCSYGVIFILQTVCFLVGIKSLLLINLFGAQTMDGGLKANCLAIEPSHAGRILAFLYWGVVVLTEIMKGREMSLKEHFKENPYTTSLFFITMTMMGSATAMLGFLLVMLHFIKQYMYLYVSSILVLIILLNVDTGIEQLNRVTNIINAFLSDDPAATIQKTDGSGGSRIVPMLNTFNHLDLSAWETWFGLGSTHVRTVQSMFTIQRMGDITDFGLISYIFSLVFVYKCCIRKFFCIENLLFFILIGYSVGSIYTCWSALMVCMGLKYYARESRNTEETIHATTNN